MGPRREALFSDADNDATAGGRGAIDICDI
jgi:hypothetical protein